MALDASEDMVLLTPDEINRFISNLRTMYGTAVQAKKRVVKPVNA